MAKKNTRKAARPTKGDGRYRSMAETLADLKRLTDGCRDDMHEPDEQGVTARVFGEYFDNAGTNNELVVRIEQNGYLQHFNLATLVALARKAAL